MEEYKTAPSAGKPHKKPKAEKASPVEKQPNTRGAQIIDNYKKLLDKYQELERKIN